MEKDDVPAAVCLGRSTRVFSSAGLVLSLNMCLPSVATGIDLVKNSTLHKTQFNHQFFLLLKKRRIFQAG